MYRVYNHLHVESKGLFHREIIFLQKLEQKNKCASIANRIWPKVSMKIVISLWNQPLFSMCILVDPVYILYEIQYSVSKYISTSYRVQISKWFCYRGFGLPDILLSPSSLGHSFSWHQRCDKWPYRPFTLIFHFVVVTRDAIPQDKKSPAPWSPGPGYFTKKSPILQGMGNMIHNSNSIYNIAHSKQKKEYS